jgi:hypothetical protein
MGSVYKRFAKIRGSTVGAVLTFFRAGRSIYVLLCGLTLISLGALVMYASFTSRDAAAAVGTWDVFVAATGTNQWMSSTFLIASAGIILSINYLPRLEGEA